MKYLKPGIVMSALVATSIFYISCGDAETSPATYSYAGPGSHYTATIGNGSFTINKFASTSSTTADFTVSGASSDVYGFKKLVVSSVTGTGGPAVDEVAYGLEVPGLALFVKPLNTAAPDQVIAAVASGTCPSADLNANWVIVKQSSGSNVMSGSQDTFGTFSYTASTGVASVATKYSLAATTTNLGSNAFSSATCANGVMSVSNGGGDTAVMYLTAGGGAIVNTASSNSSNASYIFGLPAATISGDSFAGIYSGFVYMGGQSSGSKFKPIKFTLTWSGSALTGTGYKLTDPSADTTSADSATLSLTALNSPSSGFMTGTLSTPGGSATVACMLVANANSSGKQVISCAGSDPGSTTSLFNFLLVSR